MSSEGALRDRNTAGFELIETLRWEPEAGFIRLDRHLARLTVSARSLGFILSEGAVMDTLEACARGEGALRVRLTLRTDGTAEASAQPYTPMPAGAVWKLAVAKSRLRSDEPLLRHKTSRRAVYDAARAEYSRDEADEVILLNERGEVCEGTITNIFLDAGRGEFLTPALTCGLLPGVLRAEMIEEGRAREAEIYLDTLTEAKQLFVGNSLRGLIKAALG
jgi:4-amino-4-deoxychorismate lyase